METKIISTNTYRVPVPTIFKEFSGKYEYFSVWNRTGKYVAQFPIMNMALSEIKDLEEEFAGVNYSEKVYAYFDIKRNNITKTEDEEMLIAGNKAYLRRAISEHKRGEVSITVFSLFINIPLDEAVMLEFSADCEIEVRDTYEPLFLATIQNVELLGDYLKYIHLQNELLDQAIARIEKLTAAGSSTTEPEPAEELPRMSEFEIPLDGKDVFEIGDYSLEIDDEKSEWTISSFSNILTVSIEGNTDQIAAGIKEKLWDDYPGDGKVAISFEAKEIYHPDGPTGVFEIAEDKCLSPYLYLRTKGFEYALKFYGKVTFAKKWVGFTGYLKPSYSASPCFSVKIYKQLDPNILDWSQYQFQSLEEAAQIGVDQVKFLNVSRWSSEKLPDRFYQFKNLEKLSIQHHKLERLPLNELSPQIANLQKLKYLHLNQTNIETLPTEIGQLKNLQNLSIHHSLLKNTPASVWQLPELKYLSLAQNQLTQIPENLSLPKLEVLSLDQNKLTNLPPSLAILPSLRQIDLNGNLWEQLPAEVLNIKEVRLAYHQKKQLFDFTYAGADGKGLVEWDDQIYYAENDPDLSGQIVEVIEKNNLQAYAPGLTFWVKKAIGFEQKKEEDYQLLGNHRFGGMPDLPKGLAYPRYGEENLAYEFIAQINCTEIAHLQDYLPRTGILYFFLTTIHDIYHAGDASTAKVIHYPGRTNELISGKRINLKTTDYYEMFDCEYKGYQGTARKINSPPAFYPIFQNPYMFRGPAASLHTEHDFLENDAYDLFEAPLSKLNIATHVINGYGFTQHEYPELAVAQSHRGKPEDWIVLLEVDSAGEMQWGDAGTLFYVIHKSDLTRGDFSQVFCTMYSS